MTEFKFPGACGMDGVIRDKDGNVVMPSPKYRVPLYIRDERRYYVDARGRLRDNLRIPLYIPTLPPPSILPWAK